MYLQSVCFKELLVTRFREICVAGGFLVSVLAVYLVEQQLPPCSTSRIIADGTAYRTMTILQMKSHRYIAFQAQNLSKVHFCLRHGYDMNPESTVNKGHNGLFCSLSTDSNCTFCSFVCSFI